MPGRAAGANQRADRRIFRILSGLVGFGAENLRGTFHDRHYSVRSWTENVFLIRIFLSVRILLVIVIVVIIVVRSVHVGGVFFLKNFEKMFKSVEFNVKDGFLIFRTNLPEL